LPVAALAADNRRVSASASRRGVRECVAQETLSQVAAKQGFDNINIVVERPRDEDLIAEDDA